MNAIGVSPSVYQIRTQLLGWLKPGKQWRHRGTRGPKIRILEIRGILVIYRDAKGKLTELPAALFMGRYRPVGVTMPPAA